MKCNTCNYEYNYVMENGKEVVKSGDKGDFINIYIKAHDFIINSAYYDEKEIDICACPNCGTIRLDNSDLEDIIQYREWKKKNGT